MLADIDDPIGKNASSLAAHRQDGDGNCAW
jgi:hypothetical protein